MTLILSISGFIVLGFLFHSKMVGKKATQELITENLLYTSVFWLSFCVFLSVVIAACMKFGSHQCIKPTLTVPQKPQKSEDMIKEECKNYWNYHIPVDNPVECYKYWNDR